MNNPDVASLASSAHACLDVGNVAEAKKLFDTLCNIDPENAEAWLLTGALHGETGNMEQAESCINRALQLQPEYPEALLTLAHLRKASGALQDAYELCKKAVEMDTDYDEAWVFLGAICCDLNRFDEAERASREAIMRWPENAQAHASLATALCYLGRETEAEPEIRQAISLSGGYSPELSALHGRILLGLERYDEAEQLINTVLAAKPDDVTLLLNLANIKLGQQQLNQAEAIFNQVIQLAPEMENAWLGLGSTCQAQYQLQRAEQCYRKAMELNYSSIAAPYNLALLLEINGEFDEAAILLQSILAQYPEQLDSIGALACVLEKMGNIDEAIETIQPVLNIHQKNVRVAQAYSRLCKKMQQCEHAAAYLVELLDSTIMNREDRALMHFALGDLYDRQQNYDAAFEHYKKANDIKLTDYNPDDYSHYVDEMIRVFSESRFASLPASGNSSERPVFIVGMPRSGTSLVEKILSSHSAVFGAGELRNMLELSEKASVLSAAGQAYPACLEQISAQHIEALSSEYLNAISQLSGDALRVVDKLPHNFQHLGLIRLLFPNAKIIHCYRDARDTSLSCYFQNFFGYHPYTFDLQHLGRHYRDYQRLVEHWKSLQVPMLEVSYEDLVADVDSWSRKLIDYCGLEWEDQCLRFYENRNVTRTASYDQVRKPIYTSSLGRWKNYQSHLSPLLEQLSQL